MMRYYGKTDGPYEDEYACRDIHVKESPHEIYQSYNRDYPDIGWFIPAGFFETREEYDIRREGIMNIVRGWQYYDAKEVIEKYWIPRSNYRSFQQWSANQMLPRMNYLAPHLIPTNKAKCDFIISWLIDIGWDPNHSWICLPPEDPYDDVKYVTNRMWDMLNHRTYQHTKNEYCRLFHNNAHRYAQFVDMVDKSIPRNPDEMGVFLITREKIMISHLVWLAKTDVRVYDYFKERIFKEINHKIALSMAINDPLMSEEDRVQRDLMLMTAPVKNQYLTRNEGHNRIRDSIVGEHVPPCDNDIVKLGLTNFYFKEDNPYMEDYLMQRYAYFLDHPDRAEEVINSISELPDKIGASINEKYGKYDYEVIASICDAAYTCYTKSSKKPRWTKNDAINHTMELLRDVYPIMMRVQARLDPTGYEKVVHDADMNIIGAIRVIMANDDAKEAYAKMARRFGSQDPRHNKKIVELMTEIATDTINQVQVQEKFNVKNPQHILLRKEHPRNPRDMVSNFFEYHSDTTNSMCTNDKYDIVSNHDNVDGHLYSNIVTPQDERQQIRDDEMKELKFRNRVMKKYGVDHLGDAAERYLPEFEAHKINYVGHKDRDIFKSNITERRRKLDDETRRDMFEKYDLCPYIEEEDDTSVDLSDIEKDDLVAVVNECFTRMGQNYIRDLLDNFDIEAKAEYSEVESDKMEEDRVELLRSNVEEIIGSGDPLYIKNGLGEKGSFIPEDVDMNNEKMIDMIEWMTTKELEDFIDTYVDENGRRRINRLIHRGYTEDDIRDELINNVDDLVYMYNQARSDDEDDDIDIDTLSEQLREVIDSLNKRELVVIIKNILDDSDTSRFMGLIDAGMYIRDIRNRLHNLLIDEYDPRYIIDTFFDGDDEDDTINRSNSDHRSNMRSHLTKDDVYDKFDREIIKGNSLYRFMGHFMEDSEFESIIRTLESMGGTIKDAKEVAWNMVSKKGSLEEINDAIDQFSDFSDEDDDSNYYTDDEMEDEEEEYIESDKQVFLNKLKSTLKNLSRQKLIDFVGDYFDERDARYLLRFRNEREFYSRVFNLIVDKYDIDDMIRNIDIDEDDDDDNEFGYSEYDYDDEDDEDDGKFHFQWDKFQKDDSTLKDALIQKMGIPNQNSDTLIEAKRDFYQWMIRNDVDLDMSNDELKRMINRMNSLDFRKFVSQIEKLVESNRPITRNSRSGMNMKSADLGNYGGIISRMSKVNVSSDEFEDEEEETDEEAERNFRRALYGR